MTAARLHAALEARYAGQACIKVEPLADDVDARRLDPQALNGSNQLRLVVFSPQRNVQALLAAVPDNLGKGAAGAAVQNLAWMLGLPERPQLESALKMSRPG